MSLVKKCDICGDTYNAYNQRENKEKPNGFMYISLDMNQKYFSYDPKDCCPECMAKIRDFIAELKKKEKSDES